MGRVQRLIHLFEGGVSSLRKRAARKSLFKRSNKAPRAPKDRLHRTVQSAASTPLFRRRPAPEADAAAKPARTPRNGPPPAKAATPTLPQKRLVPPRQPARAPSTKLFVQRKLWDFGERRPREVVTASETGDPQPSTVDVRVDARTDDASADAAVATPAGEPDSGTSAQQRAAPDAATAAAPPAAEAASADAPMAASADSAPGAFPVTPPALQLPLPLPPPDGARSLDAAAASQLALPLPPPDETQSPDATAFSQLAPSLPPPGETRLLDATPGFPADDVLWALRCQALCRGHPHILQLQEVECRPRQLAVVVDRSASSVQDLIDGTACKGASPSEAAVRRLFQQLVVGIAFCHRQGLARASLHPRDLSLHRADPAARPPAGVAPAGSDVAGPADGYSLVLKLHDFSAALAAATGGAYNTAAADGAAQWLCTEQDPSYSAPEVIRARLEDSQIAATDQAAADVWSVGAVLFALLAGAPPFSRPSDAALPPQAKAVATLLRTSNGDRNVLHAQVSQQCRELLAAALEPDTGRRLTLAGLLGHPWVEAGMPAALRGVNSRLLAPPGLTRGGLNPGGAPTEESPRQSGGGGRKRQQEGGSGAWVPKQVHTLEALLAERVVGPLRQQLGSASAIAAVLLAQKRQREAAAAGQQEAALNQRSRPPPALPDGGPAPQQQQRQSLELELDTMLAAARDTADRAAVWSPGAESPQPQEPGVTGQQPSGEIQPALSPAPDDAGGAAPAEPATHEMPAQPSTTPVTAAGHAAAAGRTSQAALREQELQAAGPAAEEPQQQPVTPTGGSSEDDPLSLDPIMEQRGRELFDSPASVALLASPVTGGLRRRFVELLRPAGEVPAAGKVALLQGGPESPLDGAQAAWRARHPESPLVAEAIRNSGLGKHPHDGNAAEDGRTGGDGQASERLPSPPPLQLQRRQQRQQRRRQLEEQCLRETQPPAAAAAADNQTSEAAEATTAAEAPADDSPRLRALAAAMADSQDGTGFQRFSNDSAYRLRAAKAAAAKLLAQNSDQLQRPDGGRAVPGQVPIHRHINSGGGGGGVDGSIITANGKPAAASRASIESVRAASASSFCSSNGESVPPRSPLAACLLARSPPAPAAKPGPPRLGVPLLRLDRIPGLALEAGRSPQPTEQPPAHTPTKPRPALQPATAEEQTGAEQTAARAPAAPSVTQSPPSAPAEVAARATAAPSVRTVPPSEPAEATAAAEKGLSAKILLAGAPLRASGAALSNTAAAKDPSADAPLRASGAALGNTAALVRLVAAAAVAARAAQKGDADAAGAMWGGISLAQRQERAREHSLRLHLCYVEHLGPQATGGAVRV